MEFQIVRHPNLKLGGAGSHENGDRMIANRGRGYVATREEAEQRCEGVVKGVSNRFGSKHEDNSEMRLEGLRFGPRMSEILL